MPAALSSSLDPDVRALSQKMMLDAGHEAKDDWVFIDDLVLAYRTQYAGRDDLLQQLRHFFATRGEPVTRQQFKRFCADVRRQDQTVQQGMARDKQLHVICAQAGIKDPDENNRALALRILELEHAVQSYAQQLQALNASAQDKPTGFFPFIAGVVVGGVLF